MFIHNANTFDQKFARFHTMSKHYTSLIGFNMHSWNDARTSSGWLVPVEVAENATPRTAARWGKRRTLVAFASGPPRACVPVYLTVRKLFADFVKFANN